jgi:hypothetical protein
MMQIFLKNMQTSKQKLKKLIQVVNCNFIRAIRGTLDFSSHELRESNT